MTKKKDVEKRANVNKGILIAVVIIFALAALYGLIRAVFIGGGSMYDSKLNGQTIDCMPPLEDEQVKLCEYAESVDYPNIVY